tara:strand:- start:158 stop:730 length:573 start_codon:yes stop_codon:yes gene_type:complete
MIYSDEKVKKVKKVKDIIMYMRGFSLVGVVLYALLRSIAPPALVAIITFALVVISLLISVFVPISLKHETTNSFKKVIMNNIPAISTILLAIWSLVINANYYDRINDGKVASEFYEYSGLSLFVIICQVFFSFASIKALIDMLSQSNNALINASIQKKRNIDAITYLCTVGNIILLTIMTVILEFFSTDG